MHENRRQFTGARGGGGHTCGMGSSAVANHSTCDEGERIKNVRYCVRLCVCVSAGGITHGSSPASHENVGHQSTFEERTLLTRPRSGLGKNPPPTAVCIRRPPSRYLEHENRM